MKYKVLMAEHTHYNGLYRVGAQNIADEFVNLDQNVLYLSGPLNIYQLRHFFHKSDRRDEAETIFKEYLKGGKRYSNNFKTYPPLTLLPISKKAPLGISNKALFNSLNYTIPNITKYIKNNDFKEVDLLLVSQLFFTQLFDMVTAKTKVHRLTDDISEFDEVPNEIKILEKRAIQLADYVVVTSRPLERRLIESGHGNKVVYCPNGVNLEKMYKVPNKIPKEYVDLKGPIIIYIGAIDSWFDVELFKYIATNNKNYNFIVIGSSRIDLSELESLQNVHVLGYRPYDEISNYLRYSNVGIIPFKRSILVNSISPIKLYEYHAFGLPVVTVNWEEVEKSGSPSLIAYNQEEFNSLLSEAVNLSRSDSFRDKCIDFSKNNTWRKRAEQILSLV